MHAASHAPLVELWPGRLCVTKRRGRGDLSWPQMSICALQGSFFLGEELSMVDLMFVPFVERMVSSLLYYKGFTIRGNGMFPGIDDWFQALECRPSYLAFRSDHYTHCHDLPPQLGGAASARLCARFCCQLLHKSVNPSYCVPVRGYAMPHHRFEAVHVHSPHLVQDVRCTRTVQSSHSR